MLTAWLTIVLLHPSPAVRTGAVSVLEAGRQLHSAVDEWHDQGMAPHNTRHMYERSLGRYRKGGSSAHQKPRNEGWVSPGRRRHFYPTVRGPNMAAVDAFQAPPVASFSRARAHAHVLFTLNHGANE